MAAGEATPDPGALSPHCYQGDRFHICFPTGWKISEGGNAGAPYQSDSLIVQGFGDGAPGIPEGDDTLHALKTGIVVEFSGEEDPDNHPTVWIRNLQASDAFTILHHNVEEIPGNGSKGGSQLKVEFLRHATGRLSLTDKRIIPAGEDGWFVVTAFVSCGPGGGPFVKRSGLMEYVMKHARTFTLTETPLPCPDLAALYQNFNWELPALIRSLREGTGFIGSDDGEAVRRLRMVLKRYPELAAAHNNLAWLQLKAQGSAWHDVFSALEHARTAVALTEGRDPAMIDTLALALYENGRVEEAVSVGSRALGLLDKEHYREALNRYRRELIRTS